MTNTYNKYYNLGEKMGWHEVAQKIHTLYQNETFKTKKTCQQARLGLMAGYASQGGR